MSSVAEQLVPPYYAAVMPAAEHRSPDESPAPTERLTALAIRHPDFLGLETARTENGAPVTVSYWRSLAAIEDWRASGRALDAFRDACRDPAVANDEPVTVTRIDRPASAAAAIRGLRFKEAARAAWSLGARQGSPR